MLWKNFFHELFSDCWQKLSTVLLIFYSSKRKILWKTILLKKKTRRFRILVEVFFRFSAGFFYQVRRNCILGVERYTSLEKVCLWKKQTFFKFGLSTFFCIFEGFFDRFTKIAFVVSMGTFWRGNVFFFGNSFFLVLGTWPVIFWTFIQTLFVNLVKLAFEVSRGTIWPKLNILRNKEMFHHFSAFRFFRKICTKI